MNNKNYLDILIQSLHQKVEALDHIIGKNEEQYTILSAEEADMDAFEKNVTEKSEYVDKILFLDEGFDEVYQRVKEELDTNRASYAQEIAEMKRLISIITEKSMKVQAQEQKNKDLAQKQFAHARKKIRQIKAGKRVASQYYQSMQQINVIDPQFMDKKK